MSITEISRVYKQRKASFEALHRKQKKFLTLISILRLAVIVLAAYFLVMGVKAEITILYPVSGLLFILFFVLVVFHKNQDDKNKLFREYIQLNERELECLEYRFADNPSGDQFMSAEHPWSHDLDLFGEGSLYQYLNRTTTHPGPEKLAAYLTEPVLNEKEIKQRQELIQELASKLGLRQEYITNGKLMDIDQEEYREVVQWSEIPVFIDKYKWTKYLALGMTIVSLTILVSLFFIPGAYKLLLSVILVNLMILSPFFSRTNRFQERISKKHKFLKTYARLLDILAREEFTHPSLKNIQNVAKKGSKEISKLTTLLDLFDQRLNLLVGLILNALFLFDFYMLHRLSSWNRKHGEAFSQWIEIISNCDALISLAGFAYNHPGGVYPEVNADFKGFIAEDMGHPMIPRDKRVNNSIEIRDEKVVLITGANMAGKSTFLRSVGINTVLMYSGCPVLASKFITGNYLLYSSMRTSDSLKDDESYFYVEIKRLKSIVDKMKAGQKMLILLDEVLKGTNTTDKQKGSRGLIRQSIQHDVICFIATHDLSLGSMQEEYKGKVVNYCFESYIKGVELQFDYKITPGIAKNMNASFLMKRMGIME